MSKLTDASDALAEAFFRSVPKNRSKRASEVEWTKALDRFYDEARVIQERSSIGVLGRARVAYLFQRKLLAAGLDADTVRKVVFSLVFSSLPSKK